MTLSRLAAEFAAEIKQHDWSDAPYRADKAGHQHTDDRPERRTEQLTPQQTDVLRTNVMWVTAQVLGYNDPNLDLYEFAEACGVNTRTPSGKPRSGHITYGIRSNADGAYAAPGALE